MRFLANENLPLSSIAFLRLMGHDVLAVATECPGITDREVIVLATNSNRTVITFDRDYGELVFRYQHRPPAGVIFLRLDRFKPDDPGKIIDLLCRQREISFESALTVVNQDTVRQRKYK